MVNVVAHLTLLMDDPVMRSRQNNPITPKFSGCGFCGGVFTLLVCHLSKRDLMGVLAF